MQKLSPQTRLQFKSLKDRLYKSGQRKSKVHSPVFNGSECNFQKIINFEAKKYPFHNKSNSNDLHCRTYITLDVTQSESIKRLPEISHPNLVSVRKITRSSIDSLASSKRKEYQIFYEEVPYSIKYIGLAYDHNPEIFKKVAKIDFRNILSKVTKYLMKRGIFHNIKIGNIGVSRQGQIKIYISPEIICGNSKRKDNKDILENNQKLISWWETTFSFSEISLYDENGQVGDGNREVSNENGEIGDENGQFNQNLNKIDSLFSTVLQSSYNSTEALNKSNIRNSKVNKIHKEVKAIRQKINQRKAKLKESQGLLRNIKSQQRFRQTVNIFDSSKFLKQQKELYKSQTEKRKEKQTFQQNINCINIYNNSHNQNINGKQTKISLKKLSQYPVLSYSIIPNEQQTPSTHKQQQNPITNKQEQTPITPKTTNLVLERSGNFFDNPFDIENEQSFDTYDIEMKIPESPIVNQRPNQQFRQTAAYFDRQLSLVQGNICQESEQVNKTCKNQVETNKFQTTSAGPLQFKKFVNLCVKPQFMAKKSNIYEESFQDQSYKSFEPSKKTFDKIGKSIDSRTHSRNSNQQNLLLSSKQIVKSRMEKVFQRTKNALLIVEKVKMAKSPDMRGRFASTLGNQ